MMKLITTTAEIIIKILYRRFISVKKGILVLTA